MKTTTYHMTLSGGHKITRENTNPGSAMFAALREFPGHTITECHSGYTADEALQILGSKNRAGYINYEIPKHVALGAQPTKKVSPPAAAFVPMFDDEAILKESASALARHGRA